MRLIAMKIQFAVMLCVCLFPIMYLKPSAAKCVFSNLVKPQKTVGAAMVKDMLLQLSTFFVKTGYGYEVIGIENIPLDKGALIVAYHGALPVDFYYLAARLYIESSRVISIIAEKFLFNIPGFPKLAKTLHIIPGTVAECSNILKNGALLCILPGGTYESQFGDSTYQLLWKNRLGFAKAALDAKVDVIPVFTQNLREAFVAMPVPRSFWQWFFAKTKLPLAPVVGEFPVKLRTFVGKPIPYEPISPEELRLKIAKAINEMILEHQRLPGSIFQGILDRFRDRSKKIS